MTRVASGVRLNVYDRDEFRCVACGRGQALTVQHRQALGHGGSKIPRTELDLVTACAPCNAGFEAGGQTLALLSGWKVPRWVEVPERVPVWFAWRRAWFRLMADSALAYTTPRDAEARMRDVYGPRYDEWKDRHGRSQDATVV